MNLHLRRTWLMGAALLMAAAAPPLVGQTMPAAPAGPSVAWRARLAVPANQYAGTAACRTCHLSEYREFTKTAHAGAGAAAGAGKVSGCEACHGPGAAHVSAMQNAAGDDAKTAAALQQHLIFAFRGSVQENAGACLNCHISSQKQDFFAHSTHLGHGVSCQQCHSAHLVTAARQPGPRAQLSAQATVYGVPALPEETRWLQNSQLRAPQAALCYTCHSNVQAQFALPVHHRVPEGAVKCTDCHNPHGTTNQASLVRTVSNTCTSCHVEKRGPFVYEHAAVKVGGCLACHTPHGSVNAMLLVRRDTRTLCLECHTGFHDQAQVPHSRLGFQTSGTCIRCHVMVHGSNFDPNFLH